MKKTNLGLGIFGGSFDPIHLGHTQSAINVAHELNLAKILIIPAFVSPLKTSPDLQPNATTSQRKKMVELACSQNDLLTCDPREIERSGYSYTVDTLQELKKQYPDQTLHFIIGMDSLISFTRWHKYPEILSLCHLVVNTRPNYDISQLDSITQALLDTHKACDATELKNSCSGKIYLAKPFSFAVSSSEVRALIHDKQQYEHLLDPLITEYIDKNKLYR